MRLELASQLLIGVTVLITNTIAFSVYPRPPSSILSCSSSSSALFSDSSPSDTTSDDFEYQDVVNVESEAYEPTPGEAMVTNVMDLLPTTLGGEITSETRSAINEALYKLEALNPTKEAPAVSPLLNGVWELRYVGGYTSDWALPSPTRQLALFLYSGGYSPGLFALSLAQKLPSQWIDMGDLEITISRVQPRVEASIKLNVLSGLLGGAGGGESTIRVKTSLEAQSDVRLRETYESATVLGRTIDLPQPLQYSRDLYVTYVDADLLIVRDATGVPEVLVRKEKTFQQNWGTEPSAIDDMMPPGEESTY